ncbi:hypothetical protein SLEP1_g24689 [Rubroshorea leprosula]|uniref:Uncharacterized protein n=1 Tax=Rubroshorea leprosula TaxID=152421 RepID=A0AAV5JGG4_9ROSI|nr:hypothetical protein SLEP1_g24689 [Rubroshorea leprosula]
MMGHPSSSIMIGIQVTSNGGNSYDENNQLGYTTCSTH